MTYFLLTIISNLGESIYKKSITRVAKKQKNNIAVYVLLNTLLHLEFNVDYGNNAPKLKSMIYSFVIKYK